MTADILLAGLPEPLVVLLGPALIVGYAVGAIWTAWRELRA